MNYDDATHSGGDVYDGMDPSGTYSLTPASWSVDSSLTIASVINKEYDCSDHFFVITSTDTFGTWTWGSEAGKVKVVWNCDTLYIYAPDLSPSQGSSSLGLHTLTIEYTLTSVRAFTDVDSVDLTVSGSFWSEVWLWMGADDDEAYGSEFSGTMVSTCDGK